MLGWPLESWSAAVQNKISFGYMYVVSMLMSVQVGQPAAFECAVMAC